MDNLLGSLTESKKAYVEKMINSNEFGTFIANKVDLTDVSFSPVHGIQQKGNPMLFTMIGVAKESSKLSLNKGSGYWVDLDGPTDIEKKNSKYDFKLLIDSPSRAKLHDLFDKCFNLAFPSANPDGLFLSGLEENSVSLKLPIYDKKLEVVDTGNRVAELQENELLKEISVTTWDQHLKNKICIAVFGIKPFLITNSTSSIKQGISLIFDSLIVLGEAPFSMDATKVLSPLRKRIESMNKEMDYHKGKKNRSK